MATTVQEVFDKALALMDTMDEGGDYRERALPIINILQGELYRFSDSFTAAAGTRPMCAAVATYASSLGIDDFLAGTIMPYGLAYHLLVMDGENTAASLYLQRYQELIAVQGGAVPTASEDITDLYGGAGTGSDD